MKITTVAVAAFSLALLAACDRGEPRPKMSPSSGSSAAPATSSANSGKSEPTPPVQGQVDTKEPAQQKDFQRK
ncbi:MAG TPA: hypothetical protein VN675_07200 [Burkholderiales bacterium]|nr:hypothetical protein [Burkholderiales bacterium]